MKKRQFITKLAKIFGNWLGNFEKHRFLRNTAVATFWATLRQNWATF